MENIKVKQMVFCFENLEQIFVPIEDIEAYLFKNVHTNIEGSTANLAMKMQVCEEALIIVKPNANNTAISSFDIETEGRCEPVDLITRLSIYSDCVGVDLVYEDDTREEIYVPWDSDGIRETMNTYQHTFKHDSDYLRGKGCLCVHFGKTKELMNGFLEDV